MKYYGTFGPSCKTEETLSQLLEAGMTGMRLNLSHTGLEDCEGWIRNYQKAQRAAGVKADLMIDLQGPELRLGMVEQEVQLSKGDAVLLYACRADEECRLERTNKEGTTGKTPSAGAAEQGTEMPDERMLLPIPEVLRDYINPGQKVLLNDGIVMLEAVKRIPEGILCEVLREGGVSSRKSIALEGIEIPSATLTDADIRNISSAKKYQVTEVMLPFVRGKDDIEELRSVLNAHGLFQVRIFAKIENLRGVEKLDEIIESADHIVIARGDLGNAVPLWKLPGLQRRIADRCRRAKKPFMVVTQLLHSMIAMPVPTRAEVSDIYRAVQEGASSLMLTGETAAGAYPAEAMRYLILTAEEAGKKRWE